MPYAVRYSEEAEDDVAGLAAVDPVAASTLIDAIENVLALNPRRGQPAGIIPPPSWRADVLAACGRLSPQRLLSIQPGRDGNRDHRDRPSLNWRKRTPHGTRSATAVKCPVVHQDHREVHPWQPSPFVTRRRPARRRAS